MKALLLAIGQLDDPACFGVLVRSVALALAAYLALLAGSIWGDPRAAGELQLAGMAGGAARHRWASCWRRSGCSCRP